MRKQEYVQFHAECCERMTEITKQKNADYTGASDDPFKNFKLVNDFGCVTTEQGFFTRMCDKMSRISSFIEKGELLVKDESVEDSLLDLANYCILFMGYLKSQKIVHSSIITDEDMDNMASEFSKEKNYEY